MTFKAINWTPSEMIGEYKMDTMNENSDFLFKNTPRAVYTLPSGFRRAEGIKIASGRATIPPQNADTATAEIRFGNFFTPGCEPNIVTGVISRAQPRVHCKFTGIGRLTPDHNGFWATINIAAVYKKNDYIAETMFIMWSAMGY